MQTLMACRSLFSSPPLIIENASFMVAENWCLMKRKKSGSNNNSGTCHLTGIFRYVLHAVLFRHRRRLLSPLLSLITVCILLFVAALSLLSPSPSAGSHFGLQSIRQSLTRNRGAKIGSVSNDEVDDAIIDSMSFDDMDESENDTTFSVPEGGGILGQGLWSTRGANLYYGCSKASKSFATADSKTHPNRILLIAPSGGLNQQRTGITDAVAVAYMLNATLVIPKMDQNSYWNDTSDFDEIFDVDWFISFLSKDVKIIKKFPTTGQKIASVRVPRKCTPSCYKSNVLPVLEKMHVVRLTKFDYRLSNKLDAELQKLRCRANYHALKFIDPIIQMGRNLVDRMQMKSKNFIALHLRFEPDMIAFSGCYYGGGEKEREELGEIRKRWKTLHVSNPDKLRRNGKCPLTPEEVGLLLRALGFGSDVHLYVASGEVYGGEETLAPLKALFPNYHTKETIATEQELAPFMPFSSRMAALDFIVCDESSVFATNNNGNMAKILAGRRRYFGHKPTIRPHAKKLHSLFTNRANLTWEEFAAGVRKYQVGFMGEPYEIRSGKGGFHENPSACICQDFNGYARRLFNSLDERTMDSGNRTDEAVLRSKQDWSDMNYVQNKKGL